MLTSKSNDRKLLFILLVITILLLTLFINPWKITLAQGLPDETPYPPISTEKSYVDNITPYYSVSHITLTDGTELLAHIINGPPTPPSEYKPEITDSGSLAINSVILPNFPAYDWVFGCSAVSGSMIAGYYDRNGYPNMYSGPTNGGVMPTTDTSWPLWSDGHSVYPNNPLIASHNGVDARNIRGSIDDYWVEYNSTANDPYITNGWSQHSWGSAIGDYMKTSQSAFGNVDGSTSFYGYINSNVKLTCSAMIGYGIANNDGTYGRKLFYEARGYNVSDCYNQSTDNTVAGGFSLANFQSEINAGNPILLNLAGHSIVGYGYNGSTIYIRDTWDNDPSHIYSMTWGSTYANMELISVSVVHLLPPVAPQYNLLPLVSKNNPNLKPKDIFLSNNAIQENQPVGVTIGYLSTIDPNPGNTFTYSLVNGTGSSGNSAFNISGSKLRSSIIFDYSAQNSYSIRIRSTDQGGLYYEKILTIRIVPENFFLNWNFEQGGTVWTEYSKNGYDLIIQPPGNVFTPYDGTWAVWLGGVLNEISYVQQRIFIPTTNPYISYMHWVASEDSCGHDFGKVYVNGDLVDTYDLCITNNTGGWVEHVVDLSAYAGISATIQIRATCNGSLNSNLFVDHVTLQSNPKGGGYQSIIDTEAGATLPK